MDQGLQSEIDELKTQAANTNLPDGLKVKVSRMLHELDRSSNSANFFETSERIRHYIDWTTKLPWGKTVELPIDLKKAKASMDEKHFGLEDMKARLIEYLAVLKLGADRGTAIGLRAPVLLLVGQAGTGRTTFAKSIAEATGRPFVRLPFGGLGSALDLRGQSRLHLEAEPGQVIKGLIRAKANNPVILLDEIDRVSEGARADIMGVLVELLDPEQNNAFLDHYIDYPVDLSQVLFVGTANNVGHIATAVMDRLEPMMMPSYTDQEKLVIAQKYLLPRALSEANLPSEIVQIEESAWPQIIRPLGYDSGIRTLQRTIQGVIRKIARTSAEQGLHTITITSQNVKEYLPSFRTELL